MIYNVILALVSVKPNAWDIPSSSITDLTCNEETPYLFYLDVAKCKKSTILGCDSKQVFGYNSFKAITFSFLSRCVYQSVRMKNFYLDKVDWLTKRYFVWITKGRVRILKLMIGLWKANAVLIIFQANQVNITLFKRNI